jgi:hypothetical protein
MLSQVIIPKNIHNLDMPDYCELRYSDIGNVFYLHHLKCSIIKFELYKYSNIEKEIKKLKILIELENILIEVFGFNGHIYKYIIKNIDEKISISTNSFQIMYNNIVVFRDYGEIDINRIISIPELQQYKKVSYKQVID